jgi:hypothetical protein
MTTPDWSPPGIDTARPSVARVYDYYLGGFHNFPADREMAQAVIAAYPLATAGVRAGREFMARAVTHLAGDLGVRQFLDLGSGIPTQRNVHEIAQAVDPAARVVYVDIDAVAVAHGEALLADEPHVGVVMADLRRPDDVLGSPVVGRLLDPSQPTAVLMMSVLHFVEDDDRPAAVIRRYRDAFGGGTGAGSWIALSHTTRDFHSKDLNDEVSDLYARTPTPLRMRSRDEVLALLDGYELVPPGLVLVDQWRPGRIADVHDPERFAGWAGVARARE